jgi:hypothetical protein
MNRKTQFYQNFDNDAQFYKDYDNKKEFPHYQQLEKMRFVDKHRLYGGKCILETPGLFPTSKVGKLDQTCVESMLTRPSVQNVIKKDYQQDFWCCKTNCAPNRYNTDSSSKYDFFDMKTFVKRKDFGCYKRTGDRRAGRGIGNLDASNHVRYGMDSRNDLETISDMELDKYRFHFHWRNYQDPNHIVFPIPRGGIDTRNLDKYTKLTNYY